MSKLKSIVAGGLALWAVAVANAQQAIKTRASDTVMKYLAVSNGTNPSNIQGTNNINHWASGWKSSALVRTVWGNSLTASQSNIVATTIPNESIWSTTISFTDMLETTRQTSWEVLLTLIQKDGRTDTNNDGLRDGHFTQWILPTLQTNGNTIPDGTDLRLTTPVLTDLGTWWTSVSTKDDRLERDETTAKWIDVTTNPDGSPENNNRIDRVQYLGIDTHEMTTANIYPNPTSDHLTISTPDDAGTKKIEIYSISGQLLTKKITQPGTEHIVNLDELAPGIYILTTENERWEKTMNKIIKK